MSLIRCKNGHLFSEKKHGSICPYCNVVVNKNSNAVEDPQGKYSDIVYLNDLEVLKPVTGWLVCLEGPSRGRDYRVIAEKNFIGRASDMEIRITGDDTVCLRNHAVLVYDPEKNRTMLLPGDSQGLVYILDDDDNWDLYCHSYFRAKIIQDCPCPYFLYNVFIFFGMKCFETQWVFQVTERSFLIPS